MMTQDEVDELVRVDLDELEAMPGDARTFAGRVEMVICMSRVLLEPDEARAMVDSMASRDPVEQWRHRLAEELAALPRIVQLRAQARSSVVDTARTMRVRAEAARLDCAKQRSQWQEHRESGDGFLVQ
jgi:hypothetical protein